MNPIDEKDIYTLFWDMHSGGGTKVKIDGNKKELIFIKGDDETAVKIFKDTFDRDPYNETCECCGQDYSLEIGDFDSISSYHKTDLGRFGPHSPLTTEELASHPSVMVIN